MQTVRTPSQAQESALPLLCGTETAGAALAQARGGRDVEKRFVLPSPKCPAAGAQVTASASASLSRAVAEARELLAFVVLVPLVVVLVLAALRAAFGFPGLTDFGF